MKGYIKEILICPECGGESTWNFDMAKRSDLQMKVTDTVTCPECGWSGEMEDCEVTNVIPYMVNMKCPKCESLKVEFIDRPEEFAE